MSQLQEWFQDNPRARPILMTALLFVGCLGIGIWSTAGSSRPVATINRTPEPATTPDPQPEEPAPFPPAGHRSERFDAIRPDGTHVTVTRDIDTGEQLVAEA